MNTFTFSDNAQILSVFNFSPDTQEFIGESNVYIAPNTGLPNYCTLTPPPQKLQVLLLYGQLINGNLLKIIEAKLFITKLMAARLLLINWVNCLKLSPSFPLPVLLSVGMAKNGSHQLMMLNRRNVPKSKHCATPSLPTTSSSTTITSTVIQAAASNNSHSQKWERRKKFRQV